MATTPDTRIARSELSPRRGALPVDMAWLHGEVVRPTYAKAMGKDRNNTLYLAPTLHTTVHKPVVTPSLRSTDLSVLALLETEATVECRNTTSSTATVGLLFMRTKSRPT